MKVRLIKRYKLQNLYKEKGTILTLSKYFADELISKGVAESLDVKNEPKKKVNLQKKKTINNDSKESTKIK
jgi:hypothetical protein